MCWMGEHMNKVYPRKASLNQGPVGSEQLYKQFYSETSHIVMNYWCTSHSQDLSDHFLSFPCVPMIKNLSLSLCLSHFLCSWSNGHTESIISESHSVIVMSSVENSRHSSPTGGPRGRLNGLGGPRECNSFLRHARETPDSYRDSPHSER